MTGIKGEPAEEFVPIEEIPMPPEDLDADLDDAEEVSDTGEKNAPMAEPVAAAKIDFVDDRIVETIVLECPFRRDGETVSVLSVRRLTFEEVSKVIETMVDGKASGLHAVYAAMVGLSEAELRGLDDDDTIKVMETCRDFLPRRLQFMVRDRKTEAEGAS